MAQADDSMPTFRAAPAPDKAGSEMYTRWGEGTSNAFAGLEAYATDEAFRIVRPALIDNDDLIWGDRLIQQSPERPLERCGPILRGDDH